MTHDQLQSDLAAHLRANSSRMVWENTQLGPSGSPRPDVYSIDKSFAHFQADAYEIKISVSDLRSDVTSGKWQKYRKFAHRVWFAFPKGLVQHDIIPKECGIIARSENGWRAARKPVSQVLDTLPRDAWLKLLMDDCGAPPEPQPRFANQWKLQDELRKKVGQEAADLFSARLDSHYKYKSATEYKEKTAERIRAEADGEIAAARRQRAILDESMKSLAEALKIPIEGLTPAGLANELYNISSALTNTRYLDNAIRSITDLRDFLKKNTNNC